MPAAVVIKPSDVMAVHMRPQASQQQLPCPAQQPRLAHADSDALEGVSTGLCSLPQEAWANIAEHLTVSDLLQLHASCSLAATSLDGVPGLWQQASRQQLAWHSASDASTRSALAAVAGVARQAARGSIRPRAHGLPSWWRVKPGQEKDMVKVPPPGAACSLWAAAQRLLALVSGQAYHLSLGQQLGDEQGACVSRLSSSPRTGRACSHVLMVIEHKRVVAELYFDAWAPAPPAWPGLQPGGSSHAAHAAAPAVEAWIVGEACNSLRLFELSARLNEVARRNKLRARACGVAAFVKDSAVLQRQLAALQAAGFPMLLLTAGSPAAGRGAGGEAGTLPLPDGSGGEGVATAAPARPDGSALGGGQQAVPDAQAGAGGAAAAPGPADAGEASSSSGSTDGSSCLGWRELQARLDGLLFGCYGKPASLAAGLQAVVRSLPREAAGVQLLVASMVLPSGRVSRRQPGRGRRSSSLSAPQLLELNVGWLSELREALPMLPCLRQVLLLPPDGSAATMDALKGLVSSTMDR